MEVARRSFRLSAIKRQPNIEVEGVPSAAYDASVLYSCGCGYSADNIEDAVKHCYQHKHSMIVQGYIRSLHRKEEKKQRSQRYASSPAYNPDANKSRRSPKSDSHTKQTTQPTNESSESFASMRNRLKRRFDEK